MTGNPAQNSAPASFRDPSGSLIVCEDRILRRIHSTAAAEFDRLLAQPVVEQLIRAGRVVSTKRVGPADVPDDFRQDGAHYFEHERIPFTSYPVEWSPAMLADAAEFTLALALDLLPHGLILKDATPANILYRGCKPVFVDLPSFVERARGSYLWLARHQFETCFLLPLIAAAERGVPIAWSLADPAGGISHESLAQLLGARRWIKPSLIGAVALPAAIASHAGDVNVRASAAQTRDDRKAVFILQHGFEQLRRRIGVLAACLARGQSAWQGYTQARSHYGDEDIAMKRQFVAAALEACQPSWVLDVGANTGEFSEMAARSARVVAAEMDETSVSRIFFGARAKSLNILPLVINIARPSAAAGWRNAEMTSFLDRAVGRFDTVLMLAVIHHLRVGAGVPLSAILELARDLTRANLVIEFVPAEDPMFAQIARGRESIYTDWTRQNFEAQLARAFTVQRSLEMPNRRVIYHARRHP
jgi:SAM-dependent methyltransferase